MSAQWDACEHEWVKCDPNILDDSLAAHQEVHCKKCDCPGDLDTATGEVFWPAT